MGRQCKRGALMVEHALNFDRLDRIIDVVREGNTHRAPIERIADAVTGVFVPIITLLAITTWIVWVVLGYSGALPGDYLDTNIGGWGKSHSYFLVATVLTIPQRCGPFNLQLQCS